MESFKFTKEMAVELDGLADEKAREFGRTFSDLIDIGVMGVSIIHFFAPHEHTINVLAAEFLDSNLVGQTEIQGHISPQHLDRSQLSDLQREVRGGVAGINILAIRKSQECEITH